MFELAIVSGFVGFVAGIVLGYFIDHGASRRYYNKEFAVINKRLGDVVRRHEDTNESL